MMSYTEFLKESLESENSIEKVANYLINIFFNDGLIKGNNIISPDIPPGKKYRIIINFTEKMVDIPQKYIDVFGFMWILFSNEKSNTNGSFHLSKTAPYKIELNLYNIKKLSELKSILIHELKHIYEYVSFRNHDNFSKPDDKIEYFNLPIEIRARFSEWFNIFKNGDPTNIIKHNLLKKHISENFPSFHYLNDSNRKYVFTKASAIAHKYLEDNGLLNKARKNNKIFKQIDTLNDKYNTNITFSHIYRKNVDNHYISINEYTNDFSDLLPELCNISDINNFYIVTTNDGINDEVVKVLKENGFKEFDEMNDDVYDLLNSSSSTIEDDKIYGMDNKTIHNFNYYRVPKRLRIN